MSKSYWIWYPGDFELYHGMKQNFSRVERGFGWPAFWKSEGFRNRVAFRRTYHLEEETSFTVYSNAIGHVLAGEKKYPFGKKITCGPGEVAIAVHAGCIEAFPCIYIEGDVICSDTGWMAEDYEKDPQPAGKSKYFTRPEQNPTVWEYSEKVYEPVSVTEYNGGTLYEFETELNAVLEANFKNGYQAVLICCGESREEAIDTVNCYYSWQLDKETGKCPCCAVRFAYIPDCKLGEVILRANHQYVDIPVKAAFHCGEERLNQIWSVAEHTFRLCSGIFFIDGVKRDKWIWSGDAYQSFFVNRYLIDFCICHQITIYKKALVCISRPDPFVTFGTINKKDAAAEAECMLCHRPDLGQAFLSAVECSFHRNVDILMICFQYDLSRFAIRNVCKMYCTARTFASLLVRLPAIVAVYRVDCLFSGFATADQYRLISVFELCFQNCIQLCLKFIERSAVVFCYVDWFIYFLAVFPDCRILFRSGEISASSCRLRFLIIIFCYPAFV